MRPFSQPVSRRHLLRWALAAGIAVAGPWGGLTLLARQNGAQVLADRLRALLPHRLAAAALGVAYIGTVEGPATVASLVSELAADLDGGVEGALTLDRAALAAMLERSMHADYDAGRVVTLSGWIVSITEGRLCALASLA
ncbi:MAG: hypothetical protein M3R49_09505 [Chloroflexota bacterium]|nr:hypothetical protein [Chloroflexota bacterium]